MTGKVWAYARTSSGTGAGAADAGRMDGGGAFQVLAGLPLLDGSSGSGVAGPNDCIVPVGRLSTSTLFESSPDSSLSISPWLMNAKARETSALSDEELQRRLRREGIPALVEGKHPADVRVTRLRVTVWGFDAVEIARLLSDSPSINDVNKMRRIGELDCLPPGHALWKPAEKLATRTLYALGLDFGQVEVRVSDSGWIHVAAVKPAIPKLSEEGRLRWKERLDEFIAAWEAETGERPVAKLGADPEFVLLSEEGKVVPASRYFRPEADAGCDSVRVRGEKRWPLVELRPRPTTEPGQLAADVRRLLVVAAEKTAGAALNWRAGALPVPGLPIGGHIHLSGVALTGERLRALDNAVALPLRLLEPASAARRRPRYGALGDVRRQPHGGFEFRTPPSWLVSPRLTLGAFALAKIAAEHSRELAAGRPLDEERYRDAFYSGDRNALLEATERIYARIRQTFGYTAYKESVDYLFAAIAAGRRWDESTDFRRKWRIAFS
ncbi:putative amidoligase domain-containing protein [Cohnella soli]|uniref:PhiEco32-like amidoligase-type 2 protein n=1 Tax=Cohnella soli TaxID=425005 RepID=A0ABW0HTJ1_9BACL